MVTQTECEDWIHTAKILMSQLTGESIEELFPQRASTTLSKSSVRPDTSALSYTDHEKLDTAKDGVEVSHNAHLVGVGVSCNVYLVLVNAGRNETLPPPTSLPYGLNSWCQHSTTGQISS